MLSTIQFGGIDPSCSIMHSTYPLRDDVLSPNAFPYKQMTQSPNYYRLGLYRQFTNSSNFRDFSAHSGSAVSVRSPGFHLFCVSASGADAARVKHDGVVSLRYTKMSTRNIRTCSPPFVGSYNATAG
jgi:hypothetical protein